MPPPGLPDDDLVSPSPIIPIEISSGSDLSDVSDDDDVSLPSLSDSEYKNVKGGQITVKASGQKVMFHHQVEVKSYEIDSNRIMKPFVARKRKVMDKCERVKKLKKTMSESCEPIVIEMCTKKIDQIESNALTIERANLALSEDESESEPESEPTVDYSNAQEEHIQAIKKDTYFIRDVDGAYRRRALIDDDVVVPNDLATDELLARRCEYCSYDVQLVMWKDHINSSWHKINNLVRRQLIFRCWFGNKYLKPHDWHSCTDCKIRISKLPDEIAPLHDADCYITSQDWDVRQALEKQSTSCKEANSFYCATCEVTCFSQTYFDHHMNGRKHESKVIAKKNPIKGNQKGNQKVTVELVY